MRAIHRLVVLLSMSFPNVLCAQLDVEPHRAVAERVIATATRDSAAWERTALLVDRFGSRPSGSAALEQAIDWIVGEMRKDGLENVRTEPVMVTHWVRGRESLTLLSPRRESLPMKGLGRSVATAAAGLTAPVLVVRDFADLRSRAAEAKGKIVLFDFPFDTTLHPFWAYGQAVQYRAYGVDSAASVGAAGVLVRSAGPTTSRAPHTGGLSYADTVRRVPRIPGAAISAEDAAMLHRMQGRGDRVVVNLTMGARTLPPARSRNVIAEIRGSERPDEIIVMGGHIDSWDAGQGAMDDAAGSVAAWEALRVIKASGIRPKRTIRVVLWTNEEIGLGGSLAYRDAHRAELENHVLAMESDNGVFQPRGLLFTGSEAGLALMRRVSSLLRPMGADSVIASGPEADVAALVAHGVPAVALNTDPSRYFWYHHTDGDTIDKINPRDMAQCVAVMAVVAVTIANLEQSLPRQAASP